ncbi:response regulator [Demequina soli]|uniref:response regulator n=1 Tax=Demequina soli TaxID=1638987 RepID=UPI0007817B3A|nr:response regulator transcription factor [Demequina soli]
MTIRVLLADDQALLRATFRMLLDSAEDLEVVGEAADGASAVSAALATAPDVIAMDIRMPGLDGIAATARIATEPTLAGTRVLILTTFETEEHVLAALQAGAAGFLGKGVEPAALLDAIRTVAAGDRLLSPAATQAVITHVLDAAPRGDAAHVPGIDELTEREREIAILVAEGLSNDEIARALFISPATAKTHVNRAMTKVHARDRAQLVIAMYQARLVG